MLLNLKEYNGVILLFITCILAGKANSQEHKLSGKIEQAIT